jgi:acetyl esterase/lipase
MKGELMNGRSLLLLVVILASCTSLFAQNAAWQPKPGHLTMPLWPDGIPGGLSNPQKEVAEVTGKDGYVAGRPITREFNVSIPTLTVYSPSKGDSGAAVVVFPGGGYYILAIDIEGTEVCEWLNAAGVTCILAKYRVPVSGPFPKADAALQDAQRAIGLVRQHAADWHLDPHRIGVLGFSAGGHMAAAASTHFGQRIYKPVDAADKVSCRPDFTILVYPAYLADEEKGFALNTDLRPASDAPPALLVQAENDSAHVENSLVYYRALKDAGVPAELHLFAEGGHGYGLRPTALPIAGWPALAEKWMHTIGVLAPMTMP